MDAAGYDPIVHLLCNVTIVAVRRRMDDEAENILRHVRRRVADRVALETSLALAQSLRADHAVAERMLLNMLAGDRWRSHFEGVLATSMDAEMRHLAYASLNGTHNHHCTGSRHVRRLSGNRHVAGLGPPRDGAIVDDGSIDYSHVDMSKSLYDRMGPMLSFVWAVDRVKATDTTGRLGNDDDGDKEGATAAEASGAPTAQAA